VSRYIRASFFACIASAVFSWTAETKPRPRDNVKVPARNEKIINGALKYLAVNQNDNGSWGVSSRERQHPIAITGYTLIAFQAAGNLPNEGPHGKIVKNGMDYLLKEIRNEGYFGNPSSGQYMYGHGIATIALGELYGKTKSALIRKKLQSAIKLIITSQNAQGGWRYRPRVGDADISVTVLQVVALRAARNAGINVPKETIDKAVNYVRACHNSDGGFGYQPGSGPGFARTAAAIYSLQVCGQYDDPLVLKGSQYLIRNNRSSQQWYVYGTFYAAPAQYMIGGKTWENWYKVTGDAAVNDAQQMDNSMYRWDAKGGNSVGPIYTTAVYTTLLAMPYHYIPLYQR